MCGASIFYALENVRSFKTCAGFSAPKSNEKGTQCSVVLPALLQKSTTALTDGLRLSLLCLQTDVSPSSLPKSHEFTIDVLGPCLVCLINDT